jgi:hypothetical protein
MTPTPADRRRPAAGRNPGPPPGRNDSGPTPPTYQPSILHVALGVAVLLVVVNFGYSVLRAPAPPAPAPVMVASAPAPEPVEEAAPEPEPEPVLATSTFDVTRTADGQIVQD